MDDPLPLITPHSDIAFENSTENSLVDFAWYGYAVLTSTWVLFTVTMNSIFQIWKYLIEPLSWNSRTYSLHSALSAIFLTVDNYVVTLWCVYIIWWWWAAFSWIGLKLFRQSKGIQT